MEHAQPAHHLPPTLNSTVHSRWATEFCVATELEVSATVIRPDRATRDGSLRSGDAEPARVAPVLVIVGT